MNVNTIFNNFVKNGKLSLKIFEFIKTNVPQNHQQWQKLATKNRDEIITEFNSFSSIIRYYTLSALIVPERAVDLFQQLLFSKEDIWNIFLYSCQRLKYLIEPTKNNSWFKKSIEEGVWLIINNIVEDKFMLPLQQKWPYQPGKLKRFFTEEENLWIKGIVSPLDKDFLMLKSGYDAQQEKNTSSSFQYFYNQSKTKGYRERYKQGYSNILKIASSPKFKSILLQTLREENLKDEISHRLYFSLKKSGKNYPFFVKEKTVPEYIQEIVNVNDIDRETVKRSPQPNPSINPQQENRIPSELVQKKTVVNTIFNDFVENGNLSQKQIKFITTDIQQNYQQWQKLATKSIEEIITEFNSLSSIIRYYTLSALIVPEKAVDLFQQLLFSRNDIWEEFLKSAKYLKYFQLRQNTPYFKKSIEEGVWLIINYIIEDRFQLPRQKNFRLYQSGKLKRFFAEGNNIWIEGIFWSYQKLILTESSNTGQQQESTSSSFQGFLHNLNNKKYRNKHKKGYKKITQIFSQISKNTSQHKTEFLFFQALIEQKIKGKVSHRLYLKLKKTAVNPSLFSYLVKEKTIKQVAHILTLLTFLNIIATIILGLASFRIEIVISFFLLGIILLVIALFLFVIQGFIN